MKATGVKRWKASLESIETPKIECQCRISEQVGVLKLSRYSQGTRPREFEPEHWLNASDKALERMNRYYVAFGRGSRMCLGFK